MKRSANFVKHCQEIVKMLTRFSLSIANLGEKIVKDYVFFFALGAVQKCVNLVDIEKNTKTMSIHLRKSASMPPRTIPRKKPHNLIISQPPDFRFTLYDLTILISNTAHPAHHR